MQRRIFKCLIVFWCFTLVLNDEINKEELDSTNTELAEASDDRLLLFATLDGTLSAIEQKSGRVRWKVKDKPIVQVPLDTADAVVPIFLPDPRDGSLYLLGHSREPLKKLPFTIPQLVSSSPCRSTDGILYTGKKKDTWYKLDPKNGRKQQILGWDDTSPTCPIETNNFVYIGRTRYDIMMVDTNNPGRKWNVTFYDYTAAPMSKEELNNYDLVHFASTSSGRLITLDRRRGKLLWDSDLGSPIIATYLLDMDGLITVPFTSLANHTISYLVTELITHNGLFDNPNRMKLYPTLYVGEHLHGLYAIPSLVDQNVVTITASDEGPLLLGGPHAPKLPKMYAEYPLPGHNYRLPKEYYNDNSFQSIPNFGNHIIIYTGHYNVPQSSEQKFIGPTRPTKLLTDESNRIENIIDNNISDEHAKKTSSIGIQTDDSNTVEKNNMKVANSKPKNVKERLQCTYRNLKMWINQQENKGLKLCLIIMTGCVIAMFWYLQIQVREVQNLSQNGSNSSQKSSFGRNGQITAIPEELPDGLVKVGKITFHPEQLLGKGCEGTFVYRGEFDSRKVAVKRLLPECFTFADREVALLRESDAHPHVIRYYCMEQDRMFRYIALELCQATLSEYVQGKCDTSTITPLEILKQATAGLAHLHSLDIVHRDIKPHNVLISVPNNKGEVRAMISDFGLCKKLQLGRVSFSRRSGVTGTDGWIAPEMLNGNERTTAAVDLFSLGCLFYYVLSKGHHPFGDALRRQANILMGEYDLSELKGQDWQVNLQKPLLAALMSSTPAERPSCVAVLSHPMFWSCSKILSFFQDVSDRVEKVEADDVLEALENGGKPIVRSDWRAHIHEEVAKDLRKYRTYRGESVRDLLRALRNKKHHFRELSQEAQDSLGEIPEAFTNYWTSRFPLLLTHVWLTMQCVAHENTFINYYDTSYRYPMEYFREQVSIYVIENPTVFSDVSLDHFQKKNDAFKDNFEYVKSNFHTRSPKRSVRIGSLPEKRFENVGLYRNLNPNLGQSPEKKMVDVGHVSLVAESKDSTTDALDWRMQKESFIRKRSAKKKKKVDEPLVWAIKDDK